MWHLFLTVDFYKQLFESCEHQKNSEILLISTVFSRILRDKIVQNLDQVSQNY